MNYNDIEQYDDDGRTRWRWECQYCGTPFSGYDELVIEEKLITHEEACRAYYNKYIKVC